MEAERGESKTDALRSAREGGENGETSNPSVVGRRGKIQLECLSVSPDCNEMLPFLYLGAKGISEDCDSMRNLGINYIINCTTEARNHFEGHGMRYFQVSVDDDVDADISPFFLDCGKFIEDARHNEGKVLVHCTMGMSRSSTIVIAYLMEYHRMSLADAMSYTKEKRAMVSPNSGFMKQLLYFEYKLFGRHTIDLELYKKSRFAEVQTYCIR